MNKCILMLGIPETLLDSLSKQVQLSGYQVLPAFSLSIAGWLVTQRRFALVVVNVEHFSIGLSELLTKVREHQHAPIVALSDKLFPVMRELKYDVDFSLSIQLHPRKITAYFVAMIKQHQGDVGFTVSKPLNGWPIEQGDFFIDQFLNWASIKERNIKLSPKESQLLVYFLLRAGQTLSFQNVCTALWMNMGGYGCDERTVVEELRNKIELDPEHPVYIHSTSHGYRFYDTALQMENNLL